MSGKLLGLQRRLAKVERELASRAGREEPRECNCRTETVADPDKPEEFEPEMNRTCPAHGFRRLGLLVEINYIGRRDQGSAKLAHLLQTYKARRFPGDIPLSRFRRVGLRLKHGSQEL
jgi:hypothetical protein